MFLVSTATAARHTEQSGGMQLGLSATAGFYTMLGKTPIGSSRLQLLTLTTLQQVKTREIRFVVPRGQ